MVEVRVIVGLDASIDLGQLLEGLRVARLVDCLVRERDGEGASGEIWAADVGVRSLNLDWIVEKEREYMCLGEWFVSHLGN